MASSEETEEPKEKPGTPMIPSQGKDQNKADPESEINVKNPDFSEEHPSPRGVLEIPILGSDSDSTTSSSCSSSSTEKLVKHQGLVHDYHLLHWKSLIENIKNKSVRRLPTFSKLTSSEISKRNLNRKLARLRTRSQDRIDCGAPLIPKPSWRSFDLEELVVATENFSSEKLIGKGGHAEVYKGCLTDGQLVAVKRLLKKQNEEERTGDFLSELGIIAHIDHPNAARLLGFGSDGGLHLVLQFSPQGSLASLLHGSEESLDWKVRYKVALGVAEGLNYLHRGCHRRIIHRDIKASNILLTEDFEPQISDFGLAKWLPDQWAHHVVFPIEGTFGYLAPEYFMHGIVDEKTDVFAFGVLLLEIVTGRRAVDSCRQSLVMWAKPLLDTNNVKELADPRLGDDYNLVEMKNAMTTASMCVHHLSTARPHMSRVLQLLRGEDGSLEVMGRDQKPTAERAILVDACELEDYTCSSYLKDLNRHRQLALE